VRDDSLVKTYKLEDILALNPQIDEEMLVKAMALLQKMQERGLKGPGYKLAMPYSRHCTRTKSGSAIRVRGQRTMPARQACKM